MEAGGHRILGKKENMNNPDPEVKCADLDLSFFQRGVLLYVELNLYLQQTHKDCKDNYLGNITVMGYYINKNALKLIRVRGRTFDV